MAEYIDREAFLSTAENDLSYGFYGEFTDGSRWAFTEKDIEVMLNKISAADVQPVTHCKDCVYRPYYEPSDSKSVSDLVFPDYRFNPCPCRVEDIWYSWMPDDDWFCAYGKRKDGET